MITMFEVSFFKVYNHVKRIENDDLKDKNIGKIFDLFSTMKKLSFTLWPNELENLNSLHLDVVLKMLKFPHFNAKMNSLKEICKLIDSINSSSTMTKTSIKETVLIEWIISQKILSLAVEGVLFQ
jgi:ubiquitin carboxyl-terminal hydrolase 9/24